eukprot:Phypoly_transcript_08808.p1 GENE.Phypoly_transcript_08808~~Phypoly_transcript_08808.p1  ORF type:complete len:253 (+),score=63.94 Phypoly_transcript_08808:603-1361(+)
MSEEPGGKRQKQEKQQSNKEIDDGEDSASSEDEEREEEETAEMRVITEKLAHANMLIEEAEITEYQDKERIQKASDIFLEVTQLSKHQIEGYLGLAFVAGINGKDEEVQSNLQAAIAINPHDERIEEVKQQINDIQSGKEKEKVNVPKLISNNTLSLRFVEILEEVFSFFDKNNDGALNPTELDAFTRVVNGQPINKQTIRYMRENLDWAKNKGLTKEGFFQLYVSQTIGDSNETWEDLDKLGYSRDLEKKQ